MGRGLSNAGQSLIGNLSHRDRCRVVSMRLIDVLEERILGDARVVAGREGLQRTVGWAHVVDLPEPGPWIRRDQLLLTTGVAWSDDAADLRRMVRDLDSRGAAGLGLAVPQYFQASPDAVRQEANRLGLPLVEIPWELPFTEITGRLHRRILEEQQHIRQQAELVHRSLTRAAIEAESLGQIVAVFSRLIQRAVSLEDMDARVIAAHGTEYATDQVRQRTIERGMAPVEVRTALRERGYYALITGSQEAVRIPAIPSVGLSPRVACAVWLKNELEGIVWILEGDEPLGEIDLRAAEHAATIVALHIARERAVANVEVRLGHSLVESLMEGQFQIDTPSLERASLLGYDPSARYRIAIIALDEPIPLGHQGYLRRERIAARLARRIEALGETTLIAASRNEIFLLTREGVDVPPLWRDVAGSDAAVTIGRCHEGVAGVRQSYLEARSLQRWSSGKNDVVTYEDSLLPRLLAGDSEARGEFVDDMLRRFDGVLHADMYLATLKTLARHGFSQTRAAQELDIHPKTMQHRLYRLEQILDRDLNDPDTRFEVQLLYKLLDT